MLSFHKYQGAGNDFVMLDNRAELFSTISTAQIAALCDRRFGIGGDGLMLLSPDAQTAFRMEYFNSDGSRASFCGNGARCICAFAQHLGVVESGHTFTFIADDGLHEASCSADWVDLQMIDVHDIQQKHGGTWLNTGVPHYVQVVDKLDEVDIMKVAPEIRFSPDFGPSGTNVNFINILSDNKIRIRTYERGVEGETLACGTGIVAAAITASLTTGATAFDVEARGGGLKVTFNASDGHYTHVMLGGPAHRVFGGQIDVTI